MSTDVLSPEQRAYCMSRIKGRNTNPEMALRKALWQLGYRYRINTRLSGKPDIVLTNYRTVIFVDGCFWHKCPDHFVQPKTRAQFWADKIQKNVERDERNNDILYSQGWQVVRIWEHEIKESLDASVVKVVKILEDQKGARGS